MNYSSSSLNQTKEELRLGIAGFSYPDLFSPARLAHLYQTWLSYLAKQDPVLAEEYRKCQNASYRDSLSASTFSTFLCQVAPWVSTFIQELFGIEVKNKAIEIAQQTNKELHLLRFKEHFVKRRALKRPFPQDPQKQKEMGIRLLQTLGCLDPNDEYQVAEITINLLEKEQQFLLDSAHSLFLAETRKNLDDIADFVQSMKDSPDNHWRSLQFPQPIDYQNLVPIRRPNATEPELITGLEEYQKNRDGFDLTTSHISEQEILNQVDYCIYCHIREKDSCSKGFTVKQSTRDTQTHVSPSALLAESVMKKNPLGIPLTGCPLQEKISEMHTLRRQGDPIAALALICMDNPLCPGTGHRICNDCMKSCIYQKQDPVNIPETETGILKEVLSMPWGVEIYGLLTRFNPLHLERPYPLPDNGYRILVVGLGPAGYTLAHYLAKEGFGVVGIDGLKLEPAPQPYTRAIHQGISPQPIKDFQKITTQLSTRPIFGFGGVSEYGITARYDKNFLTLLYVTLSRQQNIQFYGGIRFGGTLTLEDAWELGFDHVALATGAGSPTLIPIQNNLSRGIRQASDFLMSLQLSGAYQNSSLANLQIRLPALVIGGGLTAIDTATELQAYYLTQVEKTLSRFETLVKAHKEPCLSSNQKNAQPNLCPLCQQQEQSLFSLFSKEEQIILKEQLDHGKAIRKEREIAQQENRAPHFLPLLSSFGGVTLVYRKSLLDSPAYRLNHEEVASSLEEGIFYREDLSPQEALVDSFGSLSAIKFTRQTKENAKWVDTNEEVILPAKTACIAAGTKPNITYEKEYPGTFSLEKNGYFTPHQSHFSNQGEITLTPSYKGVFTSYFQKGRTVSFYGDNHPHYAGSVVKAMASAKEGYKQVTALFSYFFSSQAQPLSLDSSTHSSPTKSFPLFCQHLDLQLLASVVAINRLTPNIVEVIVKAPLAAKKFQPGQFYRLQNFATTAPHQNGIPLVMEGLALTGASTHLDEGQLSLIVLEMGGSSHLCQFLTPGEPIVVMGPTGTPTEIPKNEYVCLVGGGLGNAVLFSIAKALKQNGCKVLYFAGYRKAEDLFKQEEIEASADQVIWACDQVPDSKTKPFCAQRSQDKVFVGNMVETLMAYAQQKIGGEQFRFEQMTRMIVIGSDKMMAAVQKAKQTLLKPYLHQNLIGIASVNSPMQCMMKEICAQCIQKQVDPQTGEERFVFSCDNQDQPLDEVDFEFLSSRLQQNSMQEKLTLLWLQNLLDENTKPSKSQSLLKNL